MKSIIGAILLWTSCSYALADTIAIIGTGNVAYALGTEFAAQGHTIVYGSRTPEGESAQELVAKTGAGAGATTPASAVLDAGIVVLAVPGLLVEEITLGLGDLAGKIIIDPTNPLERVGSIMTHAVATSNAEIIQAAAPGAYVVKAFNTLTVQTMMDPSETGGPVSVPLVGDNDAAKSTVAALVQGMGLEPIDVGGLKMAHWVEGMLVIWINNRFTSRPSFDFHLRPIPKSR